MGCALLLIGAAATFGCDDGSSGSTCDPPDAVRVAPGPDFEPDTRIDTFTAEDVDAFCTWALDSTGGERCIACPDGPARSNTRSTCAAQVNAVLGCGLTVGELAGCIAAFAANPCNSEETDACAPVLECVR